MWKLFEYREQQKKIKYQKKLQKTHFFLQAIQMEATILIAHYTLNDTMCVNVHAYIDSKHL